MFDSLRKPFFVAALILVVLIVLIEIGSSLLLDIRPPPGSEFSNQDLGLDQPGRGIASLALIDGMLLFTMLLLGASLVIPPQVQGRLLGIVTLIGSLLFLIGAIVMIMISITLLLLMISLLMAVPFGTAFYMAAYAYFDTTGASITLSLIMTLKIAFVVCLVLAHQRFLQNKGLILITLTSFVGTILLSFLHGFAPGFLVSITDDIGAIIIAILAIIWAIVYLIGSIPAIIKLIRVDRALS